MLSDFGVAIKFTTFLHIEISLRIIPTNRVKTKFKPYEVYGKCDGKENHNSCSLCEAYLDDGPDCIVFVVEKRIGHEHALGIRMLMVVILVSRLPAIERVG